MQSLVGAGISRRVLAVDIGGTKLAIALVDRDGTLLWTARRETPSNGEDVWLALERLLDEVPAENHPVACGVGTGGPMAPGDATVSPLNIPNWREFPLRARLAAATGLDTWVDNDAKALALGEGWVGGAKGVANYMSMVVSTGVGGGIVLDGRLLDGRTGNAGHVGHVIVEPDGRQCACGARGCLEAEASGPSIQAVTGRDPSVATPDVIERTGRLVGRAVASVSSLLDLQLATVAGSVALGFGSPFFKAAQEELSSRAKLTFSSDCRILPSKLGAAGPLIGAAAVGWRGVDGG